MYDRVDRMHYERLEALPGMTILRLLSPWGGLAAGTEIRPITGGRTPEGPYRKVYVLTGPRAHQIIEVPEGDKTK